MITFNPNIKLAIADVDDTIAPPYVAATAQMVAQLEKFIENGRSLYLVSGGGLQSIMERVTNLINPNLRQKILISHCSGAEVWGFTAEGSLQEAPYYSLYDTHLTQEQKLKWRQIVEKIEEQFGLQVYPTMPAAELAKVSAGNPLAVMRADRGPQITWEFVNNPDLRHQVFPVIGQLLQSAGIPVAPRLGGTMALDLALQGVSKDTAVKFVLGRQDILQHIGLNDILPMEQKIEVWGDRYMEGKGSDQHISIALPHNVRSLDFRPTEDKSAFPQGYNIVLWDGHGELSNGLLKYLEMQG